MGGNLLPYESPRPQAIWNPENRISNVEQGLPAFGGARGDQGISNDEAKSLPCFLRRSLFDILRFAFELLPI
jgi:hypothetical protein